MLRLNLMDDYKIATGLCWNAVRGLKHLRSLSRCEYFYSFETILLCRIFSFTLSEHFYVVFFILHQKVLKIILLSNLTITVTHGTGVKYL